jgi:predicted GIY-YIG superfamily endonuclease
MSHFVYVCRQRDDRAVYVGCSAHYAARLDTHRTAAFWWPEVRTIDLLGPYESIKDAFAVEQHCIEAERPRFNIHGRWAQRHDFDVRECDDYTLALLNSKSYWVHTRRLAAVQEIRRAVLEVEAA